MDKLFRSFSLELPQLETMDQYLDYILPLVRPWSEDLREQEYYLETRWKEIRDDDQFHEDILHIFRVENEYLLSMDGNISKGQWQLLSRSNTMILERIADDAVLTSELFDLAFLNQNFFILKKHGSHQRKYFVMARENIARRLEWRDTMELLFNGYRSNSQFIVYVVIVVILVAILVAFSFF
ncbi:MAG: hypothetical protein AAFV95_09800 [Bacteroidota bacterium]